MTFELNKKIICFMKQKQESPYCKTIVFLQSLHILVSLKVVSGSEVKTTSQCFFETSIFDFRQNK